MSKYKGPVNPIPTPIPKLDDQEHRMLLLYMEEWREIVSTQMHFNDLILRFRSVILTAFVTLIGAAFAIQKFANLENSFTILILLLPVILWITASIIDYFYYHRMLLGSVSQASKFDSAEKFKSYGVLGNLKMALPQFM